MTDAVDLAALPDPTLAALLFAVDPFGFGGIALRSRAGTMRNRWLAEMHDMLPPGTAWRRVPLGTADSRLFGGLDLTATLAAGRPIAERGILAEADGGVVLLGMAERLPSAVAARLGLVLDGGHVVLARDGLDQVSPSRVGLVALDEGLDDERVPAALLERMAFWVDLDGADADTPFIESGTSSLIGRRESPIEPASSFRSGEAEPETGVPGQRSPRHAGSEIPRRSVRTEGGMRQDQTSGEAEASDPTPPRLDLHARLSDARARFPNVAVDDSILAILVETAVALGVGSMRAVLMAIRAARALASLRGRAVVTADDAALAARLVLAPRATRLPVDRAREPERTEDRRPEQAPQENQPSPPSPDGPEGEPQATEAMGDLVLAAAKAAIPRDLLQRLQASAALGSVRSSAGRAGAVQSTAKRGRPAGVRRGVPAGAARLNVIETLRAAAPWQLLRRASPAVDTAPRRIEIRRDDLRIKRFKQKTETTTIFVVDASGSLALNRLAEAKGAIELLLAECYIRRDQVALLAFRGRGAELVLPPTRSLTRAKRCLSELPGGGPTPLAGAIDAAVLLADQIRRRGQTPVVVFLTDGRANVALDGSTGRGRAEEDAQASAKRAAASGLRMLVVDASPRPQAQARTLAQAMKAIYLPLPRAEAASLSTAIRRAGAD